MTEHVNAPSPPLPLFDKDIICPGCNIPFKEDITESDIMERRDKFIVKINIHGKCGCDLAKKRKSSIFACTGCYSVRKDKPKRIEQNICHRKCIEEMLRDNSEGCGSNDDENSVSHVKEDSNYDGNYDIEDEKSPLSQQNYNFGSDDSDDDNDNDIEYFKRRREAMQFFSSSTDDEWPKSSSDYYKLEISNKGYGMRRIVCNALNGRQSSKAQMDRLTEDEVQYHTHLTALHDKSTKDQSEGICKAMEYFRDSEASVSTEVKIEAEDHMRDSFIETLKETNLLTEDQLTNIKNTAVEKYRGKSLIAKQMDKGSVYSLCPGVNEVRTRYLTENSFGVMNNIPIPAVELVDHCPKYANHFTPIESGSSKRKRSTQETKEIEGSENRKKRRYSTMSLTQIINHFLAAGADVKYYRVGYPSDFYLDQEKRTYPCTFVKNLHEEVLQMMKDNPELSIETRIVLIRIWSDGFENKKVAGNPQYNSVQLFTATMLPDTRRTLEGLTLPVGLTYKKKTIVMY